MSSTFRRTGPCPNEERPAASRSRAAAGVPEDSGGSARNLLASDSINGCRLMSQPLGKIVNLGSDVSELDSARSI